MKWYVISAVLCSFVTFSHAEESKTPSLLKMPSRFTSTSQVVDIQTIKCSDKQYCRDNQTCCLALGVPYGCCPLPKAVCCPNKRTCCPHGFVCVEYGKICLPRYQISKMETIRVAKRTRVALKKNTDNTYDNSWLRGRY